METFSRGRRGRLLLLLILVALVGLAGDAGGFEIFDVADCEDCEEAVSFIDLTRYIVRLKPGKSDTVQAFTTDRMEAIWRVEASSIQGFNDLGAVKIVGTNPAKQVDVTASHNADTNLDIQRCFFATISGKKESITEGTGFFDTEKLAILLLPPVTIQRDWVDNHFTGLDETTTVTLRTSEGDAPCTWEEPSVVSVWGEDAKGNSIKEDIQTNPPIVFDSVEGDPDSFTMTVSARPELLTESKTSGIQRIKVVVEVKAECGGKSFRQKQPFTIFH